MCRKLSPNHSLRRCCLLPVVLFLPWPNVNSARLSASLHKLAPALTSNFLSNAPDRRSRTASLWTQTRRATKNFPITISVPDEGPATLTAPDYDEPVLAKDACRFLHNITRDSAAAKLLRDQGKTPRTLTTDRFANGCSWLYTGLNIRFKDWHFIDRVRLNCLPTNAVKKRWSDADPTCRHCNESETIPHVLCHCPTNMSAITTRHNKVVDRLTAAVRSGNVSIDQTVRPHIVVEDQNQVIIVLNILNILVNLYLC